MPLPRRRGLWASRTSLQYPLNWAPGRRFPTAHLQATQRRGQQLLQLRESTLAHCRRWWYRATLTVDTVVGTARWAMEV